MKYEIFENNGKFEVYSVYGEFMDSFNTELEAIQYKIRLETQYRIKQFRDKNFTKEK